MLERTGENYRLRERGYDQAIKELCHDEFLDFHALPTEIETGQKEVADSRIRVASTAWLGKCRSLPGVQSISSLTFCRPLGIRDNF